MFGHVILKYLCFSYHINEVFSASIFMEKVYNLNIPSPPCPKGGGFSVDSKDDTKNEVQYAEGIMIIP